MYFEKSKHYCTYIDHGLVNCPENMQYFSKLTQTQNTLTSALGLESGRPITKKDSSPGRQCARMGKYRMQDKLFLLDISFTEAAKWNNIVCKSVCTWSFPRYPLDQKEDLICWARESRLRLVFEIYAAALRATKDSIGQMGSFQTMRSFV